MRQECDKEFVEQLKCDQWKLDKLNKIGVVPYWDDECTELFEEFENKLNHCENRVMEYIYRLVKDNPNQLTYACFLAELQMDREMYKEVVETCNDAIDKFLSVRTIDEDLNLLYLKALAKDGSLFQRYDKKEMWSVEAVDDLMGMYVKLLDEHSRIGERRQSKIRKRIHKWIYILETVVQSR